MVSREWQQDPIHQHDVLKIVDHVLAVQVVHDRAQEVPVQCAREAQVLGLAGRIGDGDDLLEGDELHGRDDGYYVDVAGEHEGEEEGNHDQGPYCTSDEGLLLLGLFGLLLL